MKKLTLLLTLVLVIGVSSGLFAFPMLFDVWDLSSGGLLGTIGAYTGAQTATANYNYFSSSGHPINGPTPTAYETFVWLYVGSDGLTFDFIHNVDAGGNNYWNHINWNLQFSGVAATEILTDDNAESPGIVNNGGGSWSTGFAYISNTDGGVMGLDPASTCDWYIDIMPVETGDIQAINFASVDGSIINGWSNPAGLPTVPANGNFYADYTGPNFRITPHCVPEPGTLMLLGSGLLLGAGFYRRRR